MNIIQDEDAIFERAKTSERARLAGAALAWTAVEVLGMVHIRIHFFQHCHCAFASIFGSRTRVYHAHAPTLHTKEYTHAQTRDVHGQRKKFFSLLRLHYYVYMLAANFFTNMLAANFTVRVLATSVKVQRCNNS